MIKIKCSLLKGISNNLMMYVMCSGVCIEEKSKSGWITLATTKKHLGVRETADQHYKIECK